MKILLLAFALMALQAKANENKFFCHDDKAREKYCHSADPNDIEMCLSCYVGPSCPVKGHRGPMNNDQGILLLRGIQDRKVQKLIVAMLNKQRLNQQWSRCVPLFTWDPALASAAQAWADQCALVEYNSTAEPLPEKLHHDSWRQRSSVLTTDLSEKFHSEAGVAQTVHWARTSGFDLNGEILEALIESDIQTEDGLVDGLMTNLPYQNDDIIEESNETQVDVVFGQATHVGCGWIQFPTSSESDPQEYENFMVCNYGVGVASRTTCDDLQKSSSAKDNTLIKYFTVTSDIIKDVKACLEAVRCRRRRRKFLKTFATEAVDENDPCGQDVRRCLRGRSGLKFLDATKLRSVARSNEFVSIDVEATKCKIDTILCSLNSTSVCKERLEYCLPLIDVEGSEGTQVLCECADLILADGTRGDCSQKWQERHFCFVKQSPCLAIDSQGQLEVSKPYQPISGGLLHYTHLIC